MATDLFAELDTKLESGDLAAALDYLAGQFQALGQYGLFFEARLMRKRHELALPLIQTEASSDFPEAKRAAYEQAMIEAARETGGLYLASGEIDRAWPYFRAIGETQPMADAIEHADPGDNADAVIAIAFQEGVHPAKGLELILKNHGMCRAITSFGMYAVSKDRDRCIHLLASALRAEIVERMARAIEAQEGTRPAPAGLLDLMAERPWLFGEWDYYVDTSHLISLLPYCTEINDPATLGLFHELCEYGRRLSSNFQSKSEPPFENPAVDYGHYVQALLGQDTEGQVSYFRAKLESYDPDDAAMGSAQAFINLLVRLGRYQEAIEVSSKYLPEQTPGIPCPSLSQLCYLAGDFDRLTAHAREKKDILTYLAATAKNRVAR